MRITKHWRMLGSKCLITDTWYECNRFMRWLLSPRPTHLRMRAANKRQVTGRGRGKTQGAPRRAKIPSNLLILSIHCIHRSNARYSHLFNDWFNACNIVIFTSHLFFSSLRKKSGNMNHKVRFSISVALLGSCDCSLGSVNFIFGS